MEDPVKDVTTDAKKDVAQPPMWISYVELDGVTQDACFFDDDSHQSSPPSDELAAASEFSETEESSPTKILTSKNHPNFGWGNQQNQTQDHRPQNFNYYNNSTYQHSNQRPYQSPHNNSYQPPYQGPNSHPQPPNSNIPPPSEDRLSRIEALLGKLCKEFQDNKTFKEEVRSNMKNQGDIIKKLESQVGYLSQQILK
ncbi:uncharacterized protein LOC130981034 [Arachis stenosperma]|uniref:uncharacterized protein LOC130981034 n=1 Tax=Arachis stenosperma TaxID=217475 RepID=UPI0025AC93F2|nr:uncharacterized protein LOC130981034 [Arachis stenosperma]